MATSVKASLTSFGEYLAQSSPDGVLRFWDVSTSTLKQEYIPSSHLSTTCTCLSWGPCKTSISPRRKRKKQKLDPSNYEGFNELNLLAVGTYSGNILLYSLLKGDLHAQLDGGHSSAVNDVCWLDNYLFSCSNDQHIIQWDVTSGSVKYKWKADKHSIYSLCVIDSRNLLSASSSIIWWDLISRTMIKRFIGHASEVFRLLPLKCLSSSNIYFLSAAMNDRVINAWQLKKDDDVSSAVSFTVSDDVENLHLSEMSSNDQTVIISAVTKSGVLHVFEHQLNGKCKRPLKPKITMQIVTESKENGVKPKSIPILLGQVYNDINPGLLIVYGSFISPVFEKIAFHDCHSEMWLFREDSSQSVIKIQESTSKVKQPEKVQFVKVLMPTHMVPAGPADVEVTKKQLLEKKQLPIEERLSSLILSKSTDPKQEGTAVRANNVIHLLLQGLQSKDSKLLNNVLLTEDEIVIRNTVRKLPLPSVIPFLEILQEQLHKFGSRKNLCIKWLKGLLSAHVSYLMTCQSTEIILGPIWHLLDARTETFTKMSQLKGRLDLLLSQVESRKENIFKESPEALSTYEEVSSEDENDITNNNEDDNAVKDFNDSEQESEEDYLEFGDDSESENSDDIKLPVTKVVDDGGGFKLHWKNK